MTQPGEVRVRRALLSVSDKRGVADFARGLEDPVRFLATEDRKPPSRLVPARDRLVASYDHGVTTHEWATGYRWDVVLTGAARTFMETR